MARMINWNTDEVVRECIGVSMDRLEAAAQLIAQDAKRRLTGKVKEYWKEHGPYKRMRIRVKRAEGVKYGSLVPYQSGEGAYWTERRHGELADTIRVVRKRGSSSRNIWIMAGTSKAWWAIQTEYGKGGWRGGAKPFLRPALNGAPALIKGCLEGGALTPEARSTFG